MERNKRAIVTGGYRGIGRAILKELALRYCSAVLFTDISFGDQTPEQVAEELQKELTPDQSIKVFAFKADASKLEDAQATIDYAVEKMGGVDFLVNNAGITRDNLLMRMPETDFDLVISANLKSVFNYTKAAIKPMMAQKFGRIVNISSVVGLMGNAGQANYSASKAGILGFTKSTAKELASRNININAIAPGFIQTAMTDKLNDKQKEALLVNVPLKRLGKPEDIAKVAAFLCGPDSEYITGQVIAVDGGMTM